MKKHRRQVLFSGIITAVGNKIDIMILVNVLWHS